MPPKSESKEPETDEPETPASKDPIKDLWNGITSLVTDVSRLVAFKKADVWRKVEFDHQVRTRTGGVISVLSILVLWWVANEEVKGFNPPGFIEHVTVDTTSNQKLTIGIDIRFPHLRCEALSVDIVDSIGENQVFLKGGFEKIGLDSYGQDPYRFFRPSPNASNIYGSVLEWVNETEVERQRQINMWNMMTRNSYHDGGMGRMMGSMMMMQQGQQEKNKSEDNTTDTFEGPATFEGDQPAEPKDCWSCMDAGQYLEEGACCNTCEALKEAYADAGLPYFNILDTAPQCKDLIGCQVVGDVIVQKTAGSIQVLPLGKPVVRSGKNVHDSSTGEADAVFDTSHTIHRLRFGDRFDGEGHLHGIESPLENSSKIVQNGTYMFDYHLKLVPTIFFEPNHSKTFITGETQLRDVHTHQYSFTQLETRVVRQEGTLTGQPGVSLAYKFAPFVLKRTGHRTPANHLVLHVIGILGGGFTLARMIDALLYRMFNGLRQPQGALKAGKKSN